ncbi:MAG: oligosaccharide flippase family protein [Clostridia bacterium]|nr:oligosaccharide flippase family protein [Clostridia bacterium]
MRANGKFWSKYVLVLGSSGLTIILSFILNLIMTHTMVAEHYGFYRAYVNSTTTLCTLTSFGVALTASREFAIENTIQKKNEILKASYIVFLCIALIVFLLTIVIQLVLYLFGIKLPAYILLASATVGLMFFNRLYLYKFQGENNMLMYSILTVVPQGSITLIYIICFLLKIAVLEIWAIIIYFFSYFIILFVFFLVDFVKIKHAKKEIKKFLKCNSGYGFHLYIGGLASVASAQVLNLLVATLSGLEEYAYFTLGVSLATPVMQIPAVMGTISFKENARIKKLSKSQIIITYIITFSATIIYAIFVKNVICLLIGKEYISARPFALTMMIYYAVMGLGDFYNRFISAKGNGKDIRNSAFITGASLIISAIIFIPLFRVKGVIISEIISGFVYLILMIFNYIKTIKNNNVV